MFCHLFLAAHRFAIEVQHVKNLFFGGRLVDSDIADFAHQSEVDDACAVLLVVSHKFVQTVVLLAIECQHSIVVFNELNGLAELVLREAYLAE